MQLIEGAKWSDGDAFDADDVMFHWEDEHPRPGSDSARRRDARRPFGKGAKLEKVDAYTIRWTFETAFPTQVLYSMSYMHFCPGPSHILAPQHPKNSKNTYEQYKNAFPPVLHGHAGHGRVGAGRVPAGRHRRAASQPVLLESRRGGPPAPLPQRDALPALDLGRPRRAGGGRHRRLLQPRAGRRITSSR